MRLKVTLCIALVTIAWIAIVYAGIPYDLMKTIQIGTKVNVLVDEGEDFSYIIYIDEACTQELIEPLNFGSVYRGGKSEIRHLYIKNTSDKNVTLSGIRSNTSGLDIIWGFESATIHPGEKIHIWLILQVDQDLPKGSYDFDILIDIADLSTHYRSHARK